MERDGSEPIEYVPTQIVTEYFRHRFRLQENRRLDGILYRSSRSTNGIACVLFIDQFACGVPEPPWLHTKQLLRLLPDRTERVEGRVLAKAHTAGNLRWFDVRSRKNARPRNWLALLFGAALGVAASLEVMRRLGAGRKEARPGR